MKNFEYNDGEEWNAEKEQFHCKDCYREITDKSEIENGYCADCAYLEQDILDTRLNEMLEGMKSVRLGWENEIAILEQLCKINETGEMKTDKVKGIMTLLQPFYANCQKFGYLPF